MRRTKIYESFINLSSKEFITVNVNHTKFLFVKINNINYFFMYSKVRY